MFYRTAKGNFFSISNESEEIKVYTEIEVMDEYLNYLEMNGRFYETDDEVNEELPNLRGYVEGLEEA